MNGSWTYIGNRRGFHYFEDEMGNVYTYNGSEKLDRLKLNDLTEFGKNAQHGYTQ